ncbi:peptidoglycan bridge formation glycyltransferase FemA/FemB family protein, partial [Bifidobacterium longum]
MSATANRTDTTYTFGVITPEELDRLSEATSQGSFQQWSGQVRLAKIRGHEAECVGVCDASGNLVTGCVILYLNGRFGADGSVYFGPIGISDDPALLRAITEAIRESARRHHAVSVACWPNVAYRLYSSNGQPDGEPNDALLTGFTDAGWTHGGFHTGYDVVCQWMYVKDLTGITNGKELLASFGKRAQWSVKRAQSMGVHVREIGPDEFDVFADIERRTGERRGFATRGADYFRQFKQAYGADAHFMLAEIHIAEYVADMTAKREALQAKVARLQAKYDERPTTRIERQLGEESRNLAAADKRLAEVEGYAKKGDVLPAAASMFVSHPNEVVYQYSGSLEEYKPFYASALIQYGAMLHL